MPLKEIYYNDQDNATILKFNNDENTYQVLDNDCPYEFLDQLVINSRFTIKIIDRSPTKLITIYEIEYYSKILFNSEQRYILENTNTFWNLLLQKVQY